MQLLQWCTHPQQDAEVAAKIAHLLQKDLDWAHFLELATYHWVKPLVAWRLRAIAPDGVPAWVQTSLDDTLQANGQRMLSLTQHLLELLDLFAAHGISAVPYKGPILAATVYKNLALRRAGDLDIIVYRKDVERATALLLAQRYTLPYGPAAYEARHLKSHYHYHFAHDRVRVELHWAFADHIQAIPLSLCDINPQLQTMALAGKQVSVFAPEELLVLLCIHGMKHYWERLTWVCDIAWLLEAVPSLNWTQVMQRAEEFGLRRILLIGLALASSVLHAQLPNTILQAITADMPVVIVSARLKERLIESRRRPWDIRKDILYLMAREHATDKLAYASRRLNQFFEFSVTPNEHDFAFVQLPSALSAGYYVIRPIRVFYERERLLKQMRAWFK
jgi:hypothetical protein